MAHYYHSQAGTPTACIAYHVQYKHIYCVLHHVGGPRFPQRGLLAPTTALAASFHWFDRWWADARCDPSFTEHGWDDSGSTAVVGMVYGQELVVANAGEAAATVGM